MHTLRTVLTLIAGAALTWAVEPRQPNVIVILADDLGYGDLACHGHPFLRTPHIDRMHDEGVRLTDFHVSPMCSPSRSQLLTGVDALKNGAYSTCQGKSTMRPGIPTMPALFAQAGYGTGIFGKWHLGHSWPDRPADRGFEYVLSVHGYGPTDLGNRWNNDYQNMWLFENGTEQQSEGYCTDVWFSAAMRWMGERIDRQQPFFAYIPTNAPHFPYWAPTGRAAEFAGRKEPEFFAMVANLDDNVGRLQQFLDQRGASADTLVVFLSDNGGTGGVSTYNAGMRGGKCARYDGGHRAPCLVRWPAGGLTGGRSVTAPTQVQDLLPTFVELCTLSPPATAAFDGLSLASAMRGSATVPERSLVVQIQQMALTKHQAAVLRGPWRLVEGSELYDISTDPGQASNLSATFPEVRDQLLADYERWWSVAKPMADEVQPSWLDGSRQREVMLLSNQPKRRNAAVAQAPKSAAIFACPTL